jgi:hypothetical protein
MDGDPPLLDESMEDMLGPLGNPQLALFNGFSGGRSGAGEGQEDVGVFELNLRFGVEITQT